MAKVWSKYRVTTQVYPNCSRILAGIIMRPLLSIVCENSPLNIVRTPPFPTPSRPYYHYMVNFTTFPHFSQQIKHLIYR